MVNFKLKTHTFDPQATKRNMKSAIILVVTVMWFGVQTISPFSIMDKLSIDNLTTTPDETSLLEMSTDDSLVIDTMDVIDVDDESGSNHTNETESLDLYVRSIEGNTHRATIINHSAFQSELISSDDQMRRIILREKTRPEARSFFGLIIIPCKYNELHRIQKV